MQSLMGRLHAEYVSIIFYRIWISYGLKSFTTNRRLNILLHKTFIFNIIFLKHILYLNPPLKFPLRRSVMRDVILFWLLQSEGRLAARAMFIFGIKESLKSVISPLFSIYKFSHSTYKEATQLPNFNPMGTGGGLFRPRVIKMLAISKPMIQLPWFFLTFPQLMNTTGLPKKIICTLVIILFYLWCS